MVDVSFPGDIAVDAHFRGHTIPTDQSAKRGRSGPAPFDIFLASLATCGSYCAVSFCRQRSIDTEGLRIELEPVRDPETRKLAKIRLELRLPATFPVQYEKAILRAVEQCTVRRSLLAPPALETELVLART